MSQSEREVRTFESKSKVSPKMIIAGVIALLALIFILQNTNSSEVSVLFWDFDFPLWILMLLLFGAGVGVGLLIPRLREYRASRKAE